MKLDGDKRQIVQLHGDINSISCTICATIINFDAELIQLFDTGLTTNCLKCKNTDAIRQACGKRPMAVGVLRPNIVLYNENHKEGEDIQEFQTADIKTSPDLLLVMGTSLNIIGVKRMITDFVRLGNCASVFINKTPPPKGLEVVFNYFIPGCCDGIIGAIESYSSNVLINCRSFKCSKDS